MRFSSPGKRFYHGCLSLADAYAAWINPFVACYVPRAVGCVEYCWASIRSKSGGEAGGAWTSGYLCAHVRCSRFGASAQLWTWAGIFILGVELFPQTGIVNDTLTAPGNAFHSLLGWVLLVTVAGHALMALIHHFVMHDDTLRYMTGRKRPGPERDSLSTGWLSCSVIISVTIRINRACS